MIKHIVFCIVIFQCLSSLSLQKYDRIITLQHNIVATISLKTAQYGNCSWTYVKSYLNSLFFYHCLIGNRTRIYLIKWYCFLFVYPINLYITSIYTCIFIFNKPWLDNYREIGVRVMVLECFNNVNISVILWWSVLLVEKTRENNWPAASHWVTNCIIDFQQVLLTAVI